MRTALFFAAFGLLSIAPAMAQSQLTNVNPSVLRAAQPDIIFPDQSFSLDTDFIPTRQANLSFIPANTGWIIETGYTFSIDTPANFSVTCRIYSAGSDREILGQTDTTFRLGEGRNGIIRIGVIRGAASNTYPAGSYECRGQVTGAKRTGGNGVDWRAWEEPSTSSTTGWAQYVKEDGESRYWTGSPFSGQVRLRIAGIIGSVRGKPNQPQNGQNLSQNPANNMGRAGLIIGSNRAGASGGREFDGIGSVGNLGRDSDDAWRPPPIPPK